MNITATHSRPLLQRIHELLGAPPPRPATARDLDLDALTTSLREGDIRLDPFSAPVAVAVASLGRSRPILTLAQDERPILLLSSFGRRVRVEEAGGVVSWLSTGELNRRLGLSQPQQEHAWCSLERFDTFGDDLNKNLSPWRNTFMLLGRERANVGAITIYAIGVGLLSLALPLAVQTLVNTVAFGQLLQPIFVLTAMLTAGLVLAAGMSGLQTWIVEVVQRRMFVRLVSDVAERLPRAHIKAFERGNGPELLNRFFDIFTAQKAASSLLLGGISALLTATVGVIVLAFYHPILLVFGLVLTFSVVALITALGRGATSSTIAESKSKYAVAGWMQEMARHPFALKMAGGSDFARERLDALSSNWLRERGAHFRVFFRQLVAALALQVVAHAALLGVGGWLVVERELSVGQLVAAELIVTAIVASLSKLGSKLETLYDLVAAADKLGALLSIPLEDTDEEGEDALDCGPMARLELRNVASEDGHIEDLSLLVEPGQRLAILSRRRPAEALIDMLFGLRAPAAGSVLVDGRDLRDISRKSLRSRLGVVRGPEVLPATIADNIRAGGRHVSASEIWSLLRVVGLEEVIRGLPRGLHTKLAPSGFPLDRLEAIRLTLARVLAGSPSLLILDGVLDALPERDRESLLLAVAEGRTTLVTTHESAIAERCEATIVLDGEAASEGPEGADR
ncbi:MAG: ABC transporter ATP-binding protein [Deltaproteobacteria bacterium]|nr:ABC transporter ATP-binding protein [Deltaproteobacteria bacterium]